MPPVENGPRGITRRRLLRDAAAGTVGLAVGAITSEPIINTLFGTNKRKVEAAASPTLAPTPTTTPQITPDKTAEPTKTPEIVAPHIDGLRYDSASKKYLAEANNTYGLEVNAYGGEFKPNVSIEQKKTGGVVLVTPVVSKLLEKKIASIPDQKDKWAIPLPVDLREYGGKDLNVSFENGGVSNNIPIVRLSFEGSLPLINIIPESQKLRIVKSPVYGWGYLDPDRLVDPYYGSIFPGKEMMYITVGGKFKTFTQEVTISSKFGDKIDEVDNSLIVSMTSSAQWGNVNPDKLLYADTAPVFVVSNNP